jgi:adenylate kinase
MNIRSSTPEARTTNRIMVVTGVSSCGKDFLIDKASAAGLIPKPVRIFHFGQELFRQAQMSYPELRTRDELKTKLSGQQVRTEISGTIGRLLGVQPALLNTHVVYRQGDGLVINPDVEEELQASHFLVYYTFGHAEAQKTALPDGSSQI